PHLPYDTDQVIARAIVDAVASFIPVTVAPAIDYVYAPQSFGVNGTISLRPETFIALVSDVIRSLARHDATHFVLVDRGSGTHAPLHIISRELHEELGVTVTVVNPAGIAHDLRSHLLRDPHDGHAGEEETSLMLAIAPDRVRLDLAQSGTTTHPDTFRSGLRDPAVFLPEPPGITGDPSAATAEKGRRIFDAIVGEITAHIETWWAGRPENPPDLAGSTAYQPGKQHINRSRAGTLLGDLRSDQWETIHERCRLAVVPLGAASKEHGYHLPLQTDYLTAEALKDALLERFSILALPTFSYGYYPAFIDWPGSMSLRPETHRAAVEDIIRSLARAGFRKVLLLDTGLSTRPVLEVVARETGREFGIQVALATIEIGREAAHDLFDGEGTHANEDETSLMLAIAPDQVRLDRAVRDMRPSTVIERRDPFAPPAFVQGGKMRSESGVFGDPTKADADRGRAYLAAKVADLETHLAALLEID
ncbi:MAG: creatininase family protein, partial [Chloroflexota bacterium]